MAMLSALIHEVETHREIRLVSFALAFHFLRACIFLMRIMALH